MDRVRGFRGLDVWVRSKGLAVKIAGEIGYLCESGVSELLDDCAKVGKMLGALIRARSAHLKQYQAPSTPNPEPSA
jgi:hypothetical protein